MTVTHIVSFQFKPGTTPASIKDLINQMLALKEACLHPVSGKPYIASCTGGVDNSVQGIQNGLTHVFVVIFDNIEDRDYYALKDPVHLKFVKWSNSVLEQVQAVDFTEGEFGDNHI
ncbi:hypothetical protein BGZ63DRAFT_358595 [Mariannaea sp. PMI_226]|nr:hypothetical protein BGZ63DRAFT_358595 [Mariannaea sp. PMI_226]